MSQMERKIIALYLKKDYELNLSSFYTFVNEKSKFESFQMDLVKQKINDFKISHNFNQETLQILIRLMTAVQLYGQKVRQFSKSDISRIDGNFDFKGKIKAQKLASQMKIQTKSPQMSRQAQKQSSQQKIQTKKISQKLVEEISSPKEKKPVRTEQKSEKKAQKEVKPLSTIGQVENSSEINLTPRNEQSGPKFLDMTQSRDLSHRVRIINYEKFSADYVNPVIKYRIEYQSKKVLRRFSDFQKLLNILKEKYEGCILPKLPPKQGIKGGINYFWGIDETFLEERRKKLEDMMNRLISNKFVKEDKTLHKFLTVPEFEIEQNNEGYGAYLKSLADMALNPKDVKDYGVAYWSYLTNSKQKATEMKPALEKKYNQIQQINDAFGKLNDYRKRINTNFDKRRQLMHQIGVKSRAPQNSKFDHMMDWIEQEIEDLNNEITNYKNLKGQQSWIHELIRQKSGDGPKVLYDLNQDKEKVQNRLKNIENNLIQALDEFEKNKLQQLKQINNGIIAWRENVHP